MVVRVKVRIAPVKGGEPLEEVALANAGYESDRPEIAIPIKIAKRLRLYPPPKDSRSEKYLSAAGRFTVKRIPEAVKVTIITDDRSIEPVISDVVLAKGIEEILLNDKLLSKLKIEIIDPGEGFWRFRDDVPNLLRKSEPPAF